MTDIKGTQVLQKLNGVKQPTTLKEWFAQPEFKSKLSAVLPEIVNPKAFLTNAYNIYVSDKKLQECTVFSFLNALMDGAKVGLMPNTPLGLCFILPYKVKGVMTAQFQMGYPGHIALAHRTKEYESIYAHAVYPEDEFDYCYGYNKHCDHIPNPEGHGDSKPIFWYGVYRLKNGGGDFVVWPRKRMLAHRDEHSKAYKAAKNYGKTGEATWETDEEFMGMKTMVIQVLKLAPKSTEMVFALSTEPGGEKLRDRFKDLDPLEDMSDAGIKDAEFVGKTEDPNAKGEPITVDEKTVEVKESQEEKEVIKTGENLKDSHITSAVKEYKKNRKKKNSEDEITDEDLGITGRD